ncbi:MAG: gliding motility-associated C-terminal domain-containing protein [Bacteroidota bacterium]|nr:gliding motility-associated C-terminal domain-containing protein [Bacteroidota bacterium]
MNKTFTEGVYRFTVGSDDGVRLLIDGVEVLPAAAFALHSYTTYTSPPTCLTAGVHSLEIQYFESGGYSRLSFDFEEVPRPDVVSPVQLCVNSPAPALAASSSDAAVTGFNWYKNGTLVFSGANYTPAAAELDMSVAATTAFQVTAVYACGETQPADVTVQVLDAATLVIHDQLICESGGIVDLRDFVDEIPAGGTFTFLGHPGISGNNFDPSGLTGNIPITVDYSNGSCNAPQGTLNLTVTNTATTTVPTTPLVVCEGAADIDLTTVVSAVPAGGTFTFAGAQVTGSNFDPSGLSGTQIISVDYSVGGCAAAQATFDIDVTSTASIAVTNKNACQNGGLVNLLTLVTPTPSGGTFTFSGAGVSGNMFDPSGQSGVVNVNVTYDFNGCTDSDVIQVTVLAPTDPMCIGGNCATVVIVPKPEPATCTNSDGRMVMSIKPFTPAVNNTGVKISIDGISSTGLAITRTNFNDSVFNLLPVGNYNYTIEYGDPSCIKTGIFSIDQSGTVGTPVVSNIVSPACFGTATGTLTLDVPGETGNILEWSLDAGLTDPFKPFTAGGQIIGLAAGPAPTFQQVISVRRNAADVCYSSVTVIVPESVLPITATFGITPATCNGNDGAITNIAAAGGNDAPFTYSIDGGQSFQPSVNFNGLPGGAYTVRVRDALGCEADFPANVTFPGFINAAISKEDADCTNGGASGAITVTITDLGAFQIALSTDQFNPPLDEDYLPYNNPSVIFDNLERGQYYVYVRSNSAACPTRSAPINIFGVYDITFDLQPDCQDNSLSLVLANVTGEAGGAPLEIQVSKKASSDPPEIIYQQFPADGEIYLSHNDYAFLRTPGNYRIKIIQFQFEVVCNLSSETFDFTVPETLSARIGGVDKSYPDIPTGEMQVIGFTGGMFPYDVRIELDSASSFSLPYHSTDFREAGINNNQQIEMLYDNVPAGRYKVQVRDSQGCEIDLVARVPLDVDLFIPNLFTPNNDGVNDVFFIRNLPQEPAQNQLVITNRWGKEVFTSDNYQNNWEGTGVADGVYFYRLQISENDSLTGWIEIIRGPKP